MNHYARGLCGFGDLFCLLYPQSFVDVPVTDAGVATLDFLDATEGLIGIFGAYPHGGNYYVRPV